MREAGRFAVGMKGTLEHRGNILISFEPDER